MLTVGSVLFTGDLGKKLARKFRPFICFSDNPGLVVLTFCIYSTGLVFSVWFLLSVWIHAKEGSLRPGDWAYHIYSRLSGSWSLLSDTAMVVLLLLVPVMGPIFKIACAHASTSEISMLSTWDEAQSNSSTLLGISAINAYVRLFPTRLPTRPRVSVVQPDIRQQFLCTMDSLKADTKSKANAVYKALLIHAKSLLLSSLNC